MVLRTLCYLALEQLKKGTSLAEPQLLIWFSVAMETPDLFTPSAERVAVGASEVGKERNALNLDFGETFN